MACIMFLLDSSGVEQWRATYVGTIINLDQMWCSNPEMKHFLTHSKPLNQSVSQNF